MFTVRYLCQVMIDHHNGPKWFRSRNTKVFWILRNWQHVPYSCKRVDIWTFQADITVITSPFALLEYRTRLEKLMRCNRICDSGQFFGKGIGPGAPRSFTNLWTRAGFWISSVRKTIHCKWLFACWFLCCVSQRLSPSVFPQRIKSVSGHNWRPISTPPQGVIT